MDTFARKLSRERPVSEERDPSASQGQSLVEFALVIPVLLLTILGIIEIGRAFAAYATVQHAATEGARFAATGRCDPAFAACGTGMTGVLDSIYAVSRNATTGLVIDDSATMEGEPGYLRIIVLGTDRDGNVYGYERPGDPGAKTFVTVTHSMPVISPIISSIVPTITVSSEVIVTNETGGGTLTQQGVLPPPLELEDFQEVIIDNLDDLWEFDNFGNPNLYIDTDDPDGDGCDNLCEFSYPHDGDPPPNELDPNDPDTDGDGMPDGWEVTYDSELDPLTPDATEDPDADGYINIHEWEFSTDPTDPLDPSTSDLDTDGLPDFWEIFYWGGIAIQDALGNPDGDGFDNGTEHTLRSDPTDGADPDSDGDGLIDDWEINYFGDLSQTDVDDFEPDGVTNIDEQALLMDPTSDDTDGDLMLDGWEFQYVPDLDPTTDDAAVDFDLDTFTNLEEHDAVPQTDPTDPLDFPP